MKNAETRDKYDVEVDRLLSCNGDFEKVVHKSWSLCQGLFQFAGETTNNRYAGCLTMVRGNFTAETPELTAEIRADERIPKNVREITRESLPVFAEWQRRLDRELPSRNRD